MSNQLFGGYMPPPATGGKKRISSGVQIIPTVAGLGTPNDSQKVGICEARFSGNEPVVLQLGGQVGNAYVGGLVNSLGSPFGGATALRIMAVLEYALGSVQNRVLFDWIGGTINLPPCEFARISALPWGTTWAGALLNTFAATAAFAEGELRGAMVPRLSANGALAAATPQTFAVPAQARAVEVYNNDSTTTPVFTLKGGVTATRNYATGLWIAPTPVPVAPQSGGVVIESDVTTVANITWYLQL